MPHLHQTRVGIRRLRSSFSLFRPVLRDVDGALDAAHRLRRLALPFGPARDLDVILAGGALHGHQVHHVVALTEAREEAYDGVLHTLRSKRWARAGTRHRRRRRPAPAAIPPTTRAWRTLPRGRSRSGGGASRACTTASPRCPRPSGIACASRPRSCGTGASSSPACTPTPTRPTVVTDDGEQLSGPLAYAWHVENVQSALGAVNDHHTAASLLRSVGAGAPAVDEAALVEEGVGGLPPARRGRALLALNLAVSAQVAAPTTTCALAARWDLRRWRALVLPPPEELVRGQATP